VIWRTSYPTGVFSYGAVVSPRFTTQSAILLSREFREAVTRQILALRSFAVSQISTTELVSPLNLKRRRAYPHRTVQG
jgi:hypothetical protein